MADLLALNNDLDKTQTRHRLLLFNGKHEWYPASVMNIAFAGLQLDAMRSNTLLKNDSLIMHLSLTVKKELTPAKK